MKSSFYLIPLLLTVTAHLNAETNYLDTYNIHTTQKILNDKYCQKTKSHNTLCMEYQLEYPEQIQSDKQGLTDTIKKSIQKYKDDFKVGDAERYIITTLKEDDYGMSGTWSNETNVELFATTQNTFTLSITNGGYMGGAHGNYATGFDNYDINSSKKITLNDLLITGYKGKLNKIAEKYYKKMYASNENENLQNLGWFDNKFILANTFAITSQGLYFLYNSYEIKPYAAGQTTFLLPYNTFNGLIKKDSILSSIAIQNREKQTKQIFNDAYGAHLTLLSNNVGNNILELTIKVKNLSLKNRGWLSISFPELTKKEIVTNLEKGRFDTVNTYKRGSKIYNKQRKKAVSSKYLLVEGEAKKWSQNEEKILKFTLHVPKKIQNLFINLRASFKGTSKDLTYVPDNYYDTTGQQGFANYRVRIGL
jgi:hypothetical protein